MRWIAAIGALVALSTAQPVLADEAADKLDAARTAYGKGDSLRALESMQAAQTMVTAKLVEQFSRTMPPPPAGWQASEAESQPLDTIGGGLTVTRGYQKGESTLNATLLIDNPAVSNILALFQPNSSITGGEGGWKSVAVNGESALLRFNAANHEGEIVLALQNRAALQIEGGEIAEEKLLTDAASGWNMALIKKLLGP